MLTDFVVAPLDEVQVAATAAVADRRWPHLQAKSVDPVKLCSLWMIIEQRELRASETAECTKQFKKVANAGPTGPWVVQVPPGLVERTASITQAQISSIGATWARTEEAQRDGWEANDARELLSAISRLATLAVNSKKSLLLLLSF